MARNFDVMIRYIYILTDNEVPFYVGKTKNLKNREWNHKTKHPNCKLEVIDEVSTITWKFWECHYISLYKSWGFILKNKTSGGNGSDWMSPETREKMSNVKKGNQHTKNYKFSDQQRKNMSEAQKMWKRNPHSTETKAKMSKSHQENGLEGYWKDKKHSEESNRKRSETMKLRRSENKNWKTR